MSRLIAPIIAALVLVLVIGGLVLWNRALVAEKQTLSDKLTAETSRADTNAQAVTGLLQIQQDNIKLADEVRTLRAALDARETTILETINNAPPESDGPLAPVLRDTLNSLRDAAEAPDGGPR